MKNESREANHLKIYCILINFIYNICVYICKNCINIYERINVLLKTSAYIAFDMLYVDPFTHTYKKKKIRTPHKRKTEKKWKISLYPECLKRENLATIQIMMKSLLRKIFRIELCVLYIGNFQFLYCYLFYYRRLRTMSQVLSFQLQTKSSQVKRVRPCPEDSCKALTFQ